MAMFRSSLSQYLRYALLATAAVAVVPLLVVIAVALTARTQTSILTAGLIGAVLSLLAVGLGSTWWNRRPESLDLSFGELMIWNFLRRRNAEQELQKGAEVLGLDRKGLPLKRVPMSKQHRLKILQELAGALETKDSYTHGHSRRVERLVAQTAAILNLSEADTRELRTAAALHDVGKIRIPSRILRKPDRLTIDEQLIVQEHAAIGAWMVAGVSNGNIVTSVRHHQSAGTVTVIRRG
ncbi:MAG TPA: HD domain-containing phosphohydrolase [Actinomycetota bacterium]|nr:HD domain-containing phosphohydrolase [Actinomycetota bacterium]